MVNFSHVQKEQKGQNQVICGNNKQYFFFKLFWSINLFTSFGSVYMFFNTLTQSSGNGGVTFSK